MFDATLYALEKLKDNSVLQEKFSYVTSNTALLTIHRAESTDSVDTFKNMLNYVENIAEQQGSFVLFPVHPRTRKLIENSEISISNKIKIIDPLSYFETQYLLSKMQLVLTDSGGMQKEAYFHKVPCITLRSETEWVETVESGWNRLWSQDSYVARRDIEEYGDGNAAQNIYQLIKSNI
jgi:UDP-GlcNAc3NAcA epimerase